MILSLFIATLLTTAPNQSQLVGSWGLAGQALFELKENGRGTAQGAPVRWAAKGAKLELTSEAGEVESVSYELRDGHLMLSMNGVVIALERMSPAQPSASPSSAVKGSAPSASTTPTQGQGGASSPLAQLLTSSAWCSFSYKGGTTRTTRLQFMANGRWSAGGNRETQWSGQNGSFFGANNSGYAGAWSVNGNALLMSMEPQYPNLNPVAFNVTQNSSGYSILTILNVEYSMCR